MPIRKGSSSRSRRSRSTQSNRKTRKQPVVSRSEEIEMDEKEFVKKFDSKLDNIAREARSMGILWDKEGNIYLNESIMKRQSRAQIGGGEGIVDDSERDVEEIRELEKRGLGNEVKSEEGGMSNGLKALLTALGVTVGAGISYAIYSIVGKKKTEGNGSSSSGSGENIEGEDLSGSGENIEGGNLLGSRTDTDQISGQPTVQNAFDPSRIKEEASNFQIKTADETSFGETQKIEDRFIMERSDLFEKYNPPDNLESPITVQQTTSLSDSGISSFGSSSYSFQVKPLEGSSFQDSFSSLDSSFTNQIQNFGSSSFGDTTFRLV